jgi:hypothetical protein
VEHRKTNENTEALEVGPRELHLAIVGIAIRYLSDIRLTEHDAHEAHKVSEVFRENANAYESRRKHHEEPRLRDNRHASDAAS